MTDTARPTADRAECQVCARSMKTRDGLLVNHGYRRPGWGWLTAGCIGTGHAPYPATDALEAAIRRADDYADSQEALSVSPDMKARVRIGAKYVGRTPHDIVHWISTVEELQSLANPEGRRTAYTPSAVRHGFGERWADYLASLTEDTRKMHRRNASEARKAVQWCRERVAAAEALTGAAAPAPTPEPASVVTLSAPLAAGSYEFAVAWIAGEDNPGDDDDVETIAGYLTVALVGDLFGKSSARVAADVFATRGVAS